MNKILNLKAIINKKNGQINFSIPKKKISKKLANDIITKKIIKINIWG